MRDDDVLLDAKLNPPELPKGFISRGELLARLDEARDKDFALVSGPAGYGKSLLLSAWSRSAGPDVVWLSLGPEDSSLPSFASLLTYGIFRKLGADPRSPAEKGQDAAAEATTEAAPRYLAARLSGRVKERLGAGSLLVVLDDYHLCDGESVNAFMLELSNSSSPRLRFVLSGRSDPGLPIPKLRAQNRIEEIRTPELRFSPTDLAAFIKLNLSRALPDGLLEAIEAKTEGWPAGLRLLCLALDRAADLEGFVRDFSASHRFILDYLIEEVLAGLDGELIEFLYRTSVAEPFSAELCAALYGKPEVEDKLKLLDRMNLFLIKLDAGGRWFRYHHLFRDLLRMRAAGRLADELPSLRRSAAAWYDKAGLKELSFMQLLEGGFIEECFGFLEKESRELYVNGGLTSLLGLYERLPFDGFQSHPESCIWFGWLLASAGKVHRVPALVAWAEEAVRKEPDEALRRRQRAGLASIRAMTANRNGDFAQAEAAAAEAKSLFPEGALRDRAVASYIRATALILDVRLDDADDELEDAYRLAVAGGDVYTQGMALSERGRLRIMMGRPAEALSILAQAEALANPGGAPRLWCGIVYVYEALAYKALGDSEEALDYAVRGVELARLRGTAGPLIQGHRVLFDLYLELGEYGRCEEALASMNGLVDEFHLYPDSVKLVEEARDIHARMMKAAAGRTKPTPGGVGGPLSRREAELLELLAQGYGNQEIAERLFLSVATVKTHLHNISEKLGASNRTEIVALARRLGYLTGR